MNAIPKHVEEIFGDGAVRLILSQPTAGADHRKIDIRLLDSGYQAQMFTATQVFHKNMTAAQAQAFVLERLGSRYLQLNAWTGARECELRVTKKGKVLACGRAVAAPPAGPARHDRQKNHLLQPGDVVPPLVDMGVFTAEGKVVSAMQGKFRQINRFLEIIDDEVRKAGLQEPLRILDFGCGKSYLTFVLYHYFTQIRKLRVEMTGLDLKRDVIEACNRAAQKYGYEHLAFQTGDIGGYQGKEPIDIVITLHACDTATDHALFHAVAGGARMIFTAPCCQHEVNAQMQSGELALLTRYGIVKERFAALMTDAVRANLLSCCGYRTQLMEFIELEHTPKNLLIRAVKTGHGNRAAPLREVQAAMEAFHFEHTLYRLLKEDGRLP